MYTILIRPVSKRRRQEWGGDSALGLVGAAVLLLAMCPIDVSAWLGDLGAESVIARVQHFVEETLRQVSEIPYHLGPR